MLMVVLEELLQHNGNCTLSICYARPCLYKLIPDREYKCMVMLSEIVAMVASPIFTLDEIAKLHRLLHDHHNLFSRLYGIWAVSVNYHMSLHLPDIVKDLGPPQSFWCFGYERLNGILAGMPNSRRNIEVEVANRFVRDVSFSNCDIPDNYGIPTSLQDFVHLEADNPHSQTLLLSLLLHTTPGNRLKTQQSGPGRC
jgi:hypothetical protein